jgi:DNA-binding response OmpR family regulator
MRVLVADDDPVFLEIVHGILTGCGFEPVLASDGEEAMAFMRAPDPPRLLILDWMMPVMDGFEVCRSVRERAGSDEFILIMTGTSRKAEIAKILVAGADSYIIKPFEPLDLQVHLRMAQRLLALEDDLRKARAPPARVS